MKKSLSLLALIVSLSLIGFASCSLFEKKEPVPKAEPEEIKAEKKTGIVEPRENQTTPLASNYTFLTDSGEKVFIDSASVNLRRYQSRRVELEGRFTPDKKVFMVETVTSLGNETAVKQTYQNSELGLKFQYPSLWSLREVKSVLGMQKTVVTPYEVSDDELTTVDSITVERSENNKKLSAREWLNLDEQYRPLADQPSTDAVSDVVYQQASIGAAQLDGVKKTVKAGQAVSFYVARDAFMYIFTHTTLNDGDKDLYRNAFADLVLSFEFIPFGKNVTPPTTPPPNGAPVSPQPTPEPTPPTTPQDEEAAKMRQAFIEYIVKNFKGDINPISGDIENIEIRSVAFAYPEGQPENFDAIYVTYWTGKELGKVLLSVPDRTHPETMTRLAVFKPGATTDWELIEGTDTAKGNEKLTVTFGGTTATPVTVKKGMTLLDARSYKVKIQYPSSWYWAIVGGQYKFSNKPVKSDNVLLSFFMPDDGPDVDPVLAESAGKDIGEISGRKALFYDDSKWPVMCVKVKVRYCVLGDGNFPNITDTMKQMLETLQEE